MYKKSLNDQVHTYEDFPSKGIKFRDLLPILIDPEITFSLIEKMSKLSINEDADAIVAIDARGFIFGSMIAMKLSKPLVLARKPGKLPGELISKDYDLEYGQNSLYLQKKSIKKFNSFVVVDDILATGGTVECVSDLLISENKVVTGLNVVAEIKNLDGRSRFDFPVESQIIF